MIPSSAWSTSDSLSDITVLSCDIWSAVIPDGRTTTGVRSTDGAADAVGVREATDWGCGRVKCSGRTLEMPDGTSVPGFPSTGMLAEGWFVDGGAV